VLGYRDGFLDRHSGVDFHVTASDTVHLITCCRRICQYVLMVRGTFPPSNVIGWKEHFFSWQRVRFWGSALIGSQPVVGRQSDTKAVW